MFGKMLSLVVLVVVILACGGGSGGKMEWTGSLKGEYVIDDYKAMIAGKYPPPAPLDTGTGSASLEVGLDHILRLGKETPIPECMITFFPGSARRDDSGRATAMEFRIKDQYSIKRDGPGGAPGCVGRLSKSEQPGEIEIDHAIVTLSDDGEFSVGVDYRKKGDYEKKSTLRLKGMRGGWF